MKRAVAIVLCLFIFLVCVGCASTEEPAQQAEEPTPDGSQNETLPTATPTPAPEPEEAPDDEQPSGGEEDDEAEAGHNWTIVDRGEDREVKLAAILEYLESEDFAPPENFDKKQDGIEYGEVTTVEYYSTTTEAVRKCNVYTPPGYNEDGAYPVLYLLHGIGGTHAEWMNGKPNEIISNLIATGEAEPMVVVMPDIFAVHSDMETPGRFTPEGFAAFDNFINDLRDDLMPFISSNYSVSNKRGNVMVAGLSMGGREALFIGASMPETFGYIGAFCPAPGLVAPNLGAPGQMEPDELALPEQYRDNTMILINAGNSDDVVGANPLLYHETLLENGTSSFYYAIDGGHDFTVWKNGLYYFIKSAFKG